MPTEVRDAVPIAFGVWFCVFGWRVVALAVGKLMGWC